MNVIIDPDLHKWFKGWCGKNGVSIKEQLTILLQEFRERESVKEVKE